MTTTSSDSPTYLMIKNRLEKNLRKLGPWAQRNQINAFRLYSQDIPEFPYIVEVYKDEISKKLYCVVWFRGDDIIDNEEKKAGHKEALLKACIDVLKIEPKNLFFKKRQRQLGPSQYLKQNNQTLEITVKEGESHLKLNLTDYLDTGLFLDHRPLRSWIFKECQKRKEEKENTRFLNLFSYTCSVSVAASLGGAHSTNVDLSSRYLQWGENNFKNSKLLPAAHLFLNKDVREFLKEAASQKLSYDIIFLDPPTFSNSKKTELDFDVERDHADYIRSCMNILNSKGTLYFSCNKRRFKLDPTLLDDVTVQDLTTKSIPEDIRDPKAHVLYTFNKK